MEPEFELIGLIANLTGHVTDFLLLDLNRQKSDHEKRDKAYDYDSNA